MHFSENTLRNILSDDSSMYQRLEVQSLNYHKWESNL